MEVSGVSREFCSEDLEYKVFEVFNEVGFEITSRNIEACHRITNNNYCIIVKYFQRKACDHLMLVNVGPSKSQTERCVGLRGANPIFIKPSNFFRCQMCIHINRITQMVSSILSLDLGTI